MLINCLGWRKSQIQSQSVMLLFSACCNGLQRFLCGHACTTGQYAVTFTLINSVQKCSCKIVCCQVTSTNYMHAYAYMTLTQTGLDQSSAAAALVHNVMSWKEMQRWSCRMCCAVRSLDNHRHPNWKNFGIALTGAVFFEGWT